MRNFASWGPGLIHRHVTTGNSEQARAFTAYQRWGSGNIFYAAFPEKVEKRGKTETKKDKTQKNRKKKTRKNAKKRQKKTKKKKKQENWIGYVSIAPIVKMAIFRIARTQNIGPLLGRRKLESKRGEKTKAG